MSRGFEHLLSFFINVFTFFVAGCSTWAHHQMINDDSSCKIKKKVTFNEFQKKYCEVDWDLFVPIKSKYYESKYSGQLNPFPTSLFSKNEENEFHAGIIRFGNVGYKLTAYGYLRAVILKNQTIRNLRRNEEFLKTLRRINGYDD